MILIAECQNHRKLFASGNRNIMAFSHEFDPSNGFVALPCDVMDIELSPGAFRLLVELCRMANRMGECWPSLGQLSDRIGRSKASLSAYITELRHADLVDTTTQRMANGYNYRLKYCVTFWQKWRQRLSAVGPKKTVNKTECSVQPIECRVNSKNHIQENHSSSQITEETSISPQLVSIFSQWSDLAKAAPFPKFNGTVPAKLVIDTKTALKQIQTS
jgi:hypothetical protein